MAAQHDGRRPDTPDRTARKGQPALDQRLLHEGDPHGLPRLARRLEPPCHGVAERRSGHQLAAPRRGPEPRHVLRPPRVGPARGEGPGFARIAPDSVSARTDGPPPRRADRPRSRARVPMTLLDRLERLGRAAHFALQATAALPSALRRPLPLLGQLYQVLLGGLPLAMTAGVAIGIVVWLHLRGALQSVGGPGAVQYLPQALALAVVLEFAPITAGLLTAGRTGASLGAELGSMRLTEQI